MKYYILYDFDTARGEMFEITADEILATKIKKCAGSRAHGPGVTAEVTGCITSLYVYLNENATKLDLHKPLCISDGEFIYTGFVNE